MFCQTCGNKIPDDVTICPHCGQAVSADDDMASLLSELSLALDGVEYGAAAPAAAPAESTLPEEPAAAVPAAEEAAAEAAEADAAEETVNPDDAALGALFGADLIADAMNAEPAAPAAEPVLISEEPAAAAPEQAPAKQAPAKAAKKPEAKASAGKKAPAKASSAKKKTASADPKKKKAAASGSKKKKKKKKKKGGSAVLGVIIGLLVALLLIALAAGYMLFKLGFFDSLNATDEELLYTSVSEMPSTIETTATPTPTPTPTATAAPEASAEEEAPASAVEEAAAAEAAAQASEAPKADVEVTAFELDEDQETEVSLYSRGETAQISYKIEPESAESAIEWTSDDTSVATVSKDGVIDARRGGKCTITGTCGDFTVSVAVTCSFSVPDTVLDMNYEDITMSYEGQTVALEIESDDLTMADQSSIYWESSDESVATVDEAGTVTAVADGTAVISATFEDYTASCIVRCVNVTGTKGVNSSDAPYVINYEDVTLSRKGEYFQLKLTAIENTEDPEVTWVSDSKKVATVDSKGVVTAVANGTAHITTSIDGYDFECIVRVNIAG